MVVIEFSSLSVILSCFACGTCQGTVVVPRKRGEAWNTEKLEGRAGARQCACYA